MTTQNLKRLNDEDLLSATKSAVRQERALLLTVLLCLIEVEDRKLFAASSPSLFAWMTEELRYSEGEAQRRIDGARLLREFPGIAARVAAGELNLSHLSLVRSHVRAQKKTGAELAPAEICDLLESLVGKPAREAEKFIRSGNRAQIRERLRPIAEGQSELRVAVSDDLEAKLRRIKDLWAHRLPQATWSQLVDAMADEVLEKIDPLKKAERAEKRREKKNSPPPPTAGAGSEPVDDTQVPFPIEAQPQPPPRSRYIPLPTQHWVWMRDLGQCTHVGADGKRCSSRHALEVDHIQPFALGGTHAPENLRLRCRMHNAAAARATFGAAHINRLIARRNSQHKHRSRP